jgi:hypothetical protein
MSYNRTNASKLVFKGDKDKKKKKREREERDNDNDSPLNHKSQDLIKKIIP